MVFKAIILLTCLVSAHATTIKCRTGAGVSAGSHDAKANINWTDCEEGVTQCKLSGLKGLGVAAFKYGCGEKDKVEPLGCKTGIVKTKCICTGDKCTPPNPTAAKTNSKMQCRTGAGVSAGKKDAKATIYKDCEEGVTQCKLSGLTAKGLAAFTYGCGEKKVQAVGCKDVKKTTNCYCTGTKCEPKKNSANTIGTQATIGFAFILAVFSKIMA